jgi:ribosomal protein S1
VAIGPEVAFVDVGGKGEAVITIDQLKDEAGAMEVAVGDRIQAVVVSTEGGLTLSRRLARGAATDRQLEDAFEAGLPVEGRVQGAVKGGYEVRVGRHRAFCPVRRSTREEHGTRRARGTRLRVPHPRVQGGRTRPRRVAASPARRGTACPGRGAPQHRSCPAPC